MKLIPHFICVSIFVHSTIAAPKVDESQNQQLISALGTKTNRSNLRTRRSNDNEKIERYSNTNVSDNNIKSYWSNVKTAIDEIYSIPSKSAVVDHQERTLQDNLPTILLKDGEHIVVGEPILFSSSNVFWKQQRNGKLILYKGSPEMPEYALWRSDYQSPPDGTDYFSKLQKDGNFLTKTGTPKDPGTTVWRTGGSGGGKASDYFLELSADMKTIYLFQGTPANRGGAVWWTTTKMASTPSKRPTPYPTCEFTKKPISGPNSAPHPAPHPINPPTDAVSPIYKPTIVYLPTPTPFAVPSMPAMPSMPTIPAIPTIEPPTDASPVYKPTIILPTDDPPSIYKPTIIQPPTNDPPSIYKPTIITIAPAPKPVQYSTPLPTCETTGLVPNVAPSTTIAPSPAPSIEPFLPTTLAPITDAPVPTMTNAPVATVPPTEAPVFVPTDSPFEIPTTVPFLPTTASPVEDPTDAPTPGPTTSPVEDPTDAPTPGPTTSPVENPTDAPTPGLTASPFENPTDAPTPGPTASPVEDPTDAPTPEPTGAPVPDPTEAPVAPTPAPQAISRVKEVILAVALEGGEEFNDPDSCQSQSLAFLENDTNNASYSDEQIIQRYALGVYYCSTYAVRNEITDREIGPVTPRGWRRSDGWMTNTPECDWYAITCNEQNLVSDITMPENVMTGVLPAEVSLLSPSLEGLDLFNNTFLQAGLGENGNSWMGELTNMKRFFYAFCQFESSVGVPTEIGLMTNLEEYDCAFNPYEGAIQGPMWINLQKLVFLDISGGKFESAIPDQLLQLPLEDFFITDSFIQDDVSYLTTLTRLIQHTADSNPNLVGQIPEGGSLSKAIQVLSLSSTGVTGNIPASLGSLSNMQRLFIDGNNIGGEVPSELGQLSLLERFTLERNNIVGTMPSEVCALRSNGLLGGALVELTADCAGVPPQITCDCCTQCLTG